MFIKGNPGVVGRYPETPGNAFTCLQVPCGSGFLAAQVSLVDKRDMGGQSSCRGKVRFQALSVYPE